MHHPTRDSDATSLEYSSTTTPPRRPIYYVMSPTNAHRNADRVSFGRCSASASPYQPHHLYYASSPTEDSRGSSDTRFSTPLKYRPSSTAWRKIEDEDDDHGDPVPSRCYVAWLFLGFVLLLFALFFLVLWGVSKFYKPHVFVKV